MPNCKPIPAARLLAWLMCAIGLPAVLSADNARFDLTGPKIDVKVTRGGSVLPIAQVPNLQAGDKIWVHPDLPPTQSIHLLVVVAFLRGTTNPPPDNWFTRIEAWDKKARTEGVTVTVPDEAQEALIFVAPETGGDFSTLKSAVRGRPGIFVRAAADLNEASFEQQRIEHYLQAMRTVSPTDQKAISDHSAKLAATLNLKPNGDCFKQPVDQQVACLRQTGTQSLLDDGHGQTIAALISNGPSSDFINAASVTPMAGAGLYSAYVGAVVDLVRLMSGLHTAQYQYIPSIAFPQGQTLNLRLNAAPSFHNPKSVIVIGLPAIQKTTLPPLRPHDANQVSCLLRPNLVLPLEGAPLVFATSFVHNLVLHINQSDGPRDIPLKPDAYEGGLVLDNTSQRKPLYDIALQSNTPKDKEPPSASQDDLTVQGQVRGLWGFDAFTGPTVTLQQKQGKDWKLVGNTQLLAGQENHLHLKATAVGCVDKLTLVPQSNKHVREVSIDFQPAAAPPDGSPAPKDTLDLKVPLQKLDPGGYSLHIRQYGNGTDVVLPITAYTSAIKLNELHIHSGDASATLAGAALQDVASVDIAGETFTPDGDNSGSSLELTAKKGVSPDAGAKAKVKLKDGRTLDVPIKLEAARPGLKVLSMNTTPNIAEGSLPLILGDKTEIPVNGTLVFVVQSEGGFPRSEKIEVATEDNSLHTTLSLSDSSLVLQDQNTAIATLDPLKAFGSSAFGKLRMRPVAEDGTTGAWSPLGSLVRTPVIRSVTCTTQDAPCTISGSSLFLINSVAATEDFAKPSDVPTGYAQQTLQVPAPADGSTLYFKLRDDGTKPATLKLPTPIAPPPAKEPVQPATEPSPAAKPETAPAPDAAPPKEEAPANPPAPTVPSTEPKN